METLEGERAEPERDGETVYSVGHSNLSLRQFLDLLQAHGIVGIADVRRWPTSRRHPHFAGEALTLACEAAGISYDWLGEELGGYRKWSELPTADGRGDEGLESSGMRAYAAHLRTPEAHAGVRQLLALCRRRRTAMMCAERDPERCHRRLIADRLVADGHRVLHIDDPGDPRAHRLPPEAEVVEGTVRYPGEPRLPGT